MSPLPWLSVHLCLTFLFSSDFLAVTHVTLSEISIDCYSVQRFVHSDKQSFNYGLDGLSSVALNVEGIAILFILSRLFNLSLFQDKSIGNL